ncbi:MAG TPA: hypothetical protein DCQ93_08950 [Bacteroidetes bacterium]|nr:hypothetical protein [Bacteroidota bacterium]
MKKIELEIVALSHSITQSHSYAVVLGEVGGIRRLPIVIGGFEAQAIAVALEKMNPSRPLTHDLMKTLCQSFAINLKEIVINNLVDGIFFSQLVCQRDNEIIEIDSRTSDAIALAIRFDCSIFTYDFILDSAGLVIEEQDQDKPAGSASSSKEEKKKAEPKSPAVSASLTNADLSKHSLKELNDMLQKFIEKEDYERAIAVRDEIGRRKKQS